ncbi:MAG: hypothetical protein QOJ50_1897, partial [Cryptosporangiaceae bacterium]|nr:hypothetical protein [Cryptosporangiaceae bacterium]
MITLPHSHLQAPHDRLRISSLKQLTMSGGVAFTATLRLGSKKAGVIEDSGRGGGPLFQPEPGSGFGYAELNE